MTTAGAQRQGHAERRANLLEAACRALAQRGAGGVSVRAIAAEAAVSPGLVTHYFESVEQLMAETYRHFMAKVASALDEEALPAAMTGCDRLLAHVAACFAPPVLQPHNIAAWLALHSLASSMPVLAAAHEEAYADVHRRLVAWLVECGLGPEAGREAIGIQAMIEGLWLQLSLGRGGLTADVARAEAERWIADRYR